MDNKLLLLSGGVYDLKVNIVRKSVEGRRKNTEVEDREALKQANT